MSKDKSTLIVKKENEVTLTLVFYKCGICETGLLIDLNMVRVDNKRVSSYLHKCNRCTNGEWLNKRYPHDPQGVD